jgi:hypothetical protein
VDGNVVAAKVRTVLRGSKDTVLAFTAKTFLNTRLRGIGEMTQLSIDTKRRASHLRLVLSGETEPIDIHVTKYAVLRRGDVATLTIVGATASRTWLAAALREFVVDRSIRIPANAGALLKLLT